jgi:hypothetical protein
MTVIGLLQLDGKWPNLALMHLAGYWCEQGAEVRRIMALEQNTVDVLYVAKVFAGPNTTPLREDAVRGGTGWNDWRELPVLPDEIEHAYPAYDLWGYEGAMGYLTRGCIRHCSFCYVPRKEGRIHHHAHLSEWWRGQGHICLLDANLTAHPDCLGYLEELAASSAQVDFSQGVDVRLMTPEIATALSKVRRYKQLHIAWDNPADERSVERGIASLMAAMPRGSVMAYVLIGYNTTPEQDMMRVRRLSEWGVDPFVMPYNRTDTYQRRFARWVNHKAVYKSVAWEAYR